MRMLRLGSALFALGILTGCSISFDLPELAPNPMPNESDRRIISESVFRIVRMMKDAGAVEISEVGPNEAQSGPEKWTVCARANIAQELRYYTFFVKGSSIAASRASVINDRCEARSYTPLSER